jgi:hypothetical protein
MLDVTNCPWNANPVKTFSCTQNCYVSVSKWISPLYGVSIREFIDQAAILLYNLLVAVGKIKREFADPS